MKKAELVFVPTPGMGHLISTMEVAKLMLDLTPHLYITVIIIKPSYETKVTVYVDSFKLKANTTTSGRINFITIPLPEPPKDATPAKLFSSFAETQRPLVKDAVTNHIQNSNSVPDTPQFAGFVFDMFYAAWVDLADEFGVPSYVFFTSSAACLGFQFFIQTHLVDYIVGLKDSDTDFTIPSYVNLVSTKFFPSAIFNPDTCAMIHNMARGLRDVKGIMVNTFSELEYHALNSIANDGRLPPVYPVGPLLNLELSSEVQNNSDSIMKWLDEQPPSSVVFLCFGSMGSFDVGQVREIACALEQSGYRFLWSLRQPQDLSKGKKTASSTDYDNVAEVLPEGFLDRTAEIGKIIGWAPQVAILAHPAIGGFVSHCGWNSILESVWFGVPIATWPLYAEQQMNAFQLVMDLGLAVEITMDYRRDNFWRGETKIVSSEEIERGIKCLMEQDSDVRKRMKERSEKSRKAVMNCGSSHSALCRFINDVIDNIP